MRTRSVSAALAVVAWALGPAAGEAAAPAPPGRLEVLSATYGLNVKAQLGNVTDHVAAACNGKSRCAYRIDYDNFFDPSPGLQKDFRVTFRCRYDATPRTLVVPPEAGQGSVVTLSCT